MSDPAREWIDRLDLQPLPIEGGWFRETARSDEQVALDRYGEPRDLYTSIYYLLTPDTFSALHRLKSDEVYTFVAGDPIDLLMLARDGSGSEHRLANTGDPGTEPSLLVPRGTWQGSRLAEGGRFALLTTTVVPGFDPRDFEIGARETLLSEYGDFRERILALTRG